VSRACKVMGVPRDTFYRYKELVEEGGLGPHSDPILLVFLPVKGDG
jgi:ACT domain-containing protein